MSKVFTIPAALLLVSVLLTGCFQSIAITTMAGIMNYGFEAFNEESDTQLAKEGLASNLKLLEALIKGEPDNETLLIYASQGYNAYALAFVEDDSVERARPLYLRARDYALRILIQKSAFKSVMNKDLESFQRAVGSLTKDDVPAAFWTAFSWGSYINMTRTDPEALADLPRAEALMNFVRRTDSSYYYGGAHLFLGTIEGSMPAVLGGRPEKAKQYFETCLSINGGKFLMTYVYYAKTYAIQIQDRQLYESLLNKVIDAPADILPAVNLPNAVAKQKARRLLAKANDLF